MNDVVLGILELLKAHSRVLYINMDFLHPDAVEEAFYSTNRVLTCSFHRVLNEDTSFSGGGKVDDIGEGQGQGFSVNFPLNAGVDDAMYCGLFKSVVDTLVRLYKPDCIFLQAGASGLAGERDCDFNVSLQGHAACVAHVRETNLPLLVVGGPSLNIANTARVWAYDTLLLAGMPVEGGVTAGLALKNDFKYKDYFNKDSFDIQALDFQNKNTPEEVAKMLEVWCIMICCVVEITRINSNPSL